MIVVTVAACVVVAGAAAAAAVATIVFVVTVARFFLPSLVRKHQNMNSPEYFDIANCITSLKLNMCALQFKHEYVHF